MPPTPESSTHPVWPYFVALAVIALIVIVIPMIRGRIRTRQEEGRVRGEEDLIPPQRP